MPHHADGPPRLFIVDDQAPVTEALCSTLRGEGYDAVGFTSAGAALSALPGSQCELMLADLMMPEMRGIDLLHAAQQIDPALVGIIMTGEGSVAAAVESMKAGALDFIVKPFNLKSILPVLSRALEVGRLRVDNAALERRVREHAAELEAANKELAAFNHSVSHDLRAPVRALDGLTELLLKDYAVFLPAEGQRFLATMNLSVKRMKQLIDDLLRFSSLGHQALRPQRVDMATITHSAVNDLHHDEPQRDVELHIGELPPAIGDPALLRQVLVNLLSNAYKFTRHREHPLIEVGVQVQSDGVAAYFVRDNGAGFDMAYAHRLFGVFQRLHRAEEFEGTGVGLSIVQRIVERHHGRIWAEASVGHGATFYFTLGS
jgi:signal transduction histidine kinase